MDEDVDFSSALAGDDGALPLPLASASASAATGSVYGGKGKRTNPQNKALCALMRAKKSAKYSKDKVRPCRDHKHTSLNMFVICLPFFIDFPSPTCPQCLCVGGPMD